MKIECFFIEKKVLHASLEFNPDVELDRETQAGQSKRWVPNGSAIRADLKVQMAADESPHIVEQAYRLDR
jgi:hypothetical protein